jgi:hypothetical protein
LALRPPLTLEHSVCPSPWPRVSMPQLQHSRKKADARRSTGNDESHARQSMRPRSANGTATSKRPAYAIFAAPSAAGGRSGADDCSRQHLPRIPVRRNARAACLMRHLFRRLALQNEHATGLQAAHDALAANVGTPVATGRRTAQPSAQTRKRARLWATCLTSRDSHQFF